MNVEYDLHIHSYFSDGSYSPDELIQMAINAGITGISITDHDNCDAYPICNNSKLEIITGIELSTKYLDRDIEILGYFIDPKDSVLNDVIDNAINIREERMKSILSVLKSQDIVITLEDVKQVSTGRTLVRPHVAEILMNRGYVESIQDAFTKYLNDKKVGNIKKSLLKPEEVISAIHKAGGVAVLAHPFYLSKRFDKSFKNIIKYMANIKIDGIELYYPYRNESYNIEGLKDLIKSYNMIYTGGSDYHGKSKKHISIGMKGVRSETVKLLKERADLWRKSENTN
ncbi:PHP domain-containing protein [bacterium]|nr:PHP domain-containing protein [bacterium]